MYRDLILETLMRLPKKVREKILDNIVFIIATPSVHGYIFGLQAVESTPIHCILLNFSSMGRLNRLRKMDVIAHEVAHVFLGQSFVGEPEQERKADDLIQCWGFKRAYAC
jgi:hypothetical protein